MEIGIRTSGPLGANLRRNVNRSLKRLAGLGRLELDVNEGDDELDGQLRTLHSRGTGVEREAGRGDHLQAGYSAVLLRCGAMGNCASGSLRLVVLRLDGRPMAFHFALEEEGILYPLKGGFDPEFGQFSPGQLIIRASLKRAFDLGLVRYEFLGGDEQGPSAAGQTRLRANALSGVLPDAPRASPTGLPTPMDGPSLKRRPWARKRE